MPTPTATPDVPLTSQEAPMLVGPEVTEDVLLARSLNEERVEVVVMNHLKTGGEGRHLGVRTKVPIQKGQVTVRAIGARRSKERTCYSIQTNLTTHMDTESPAYYICHSCRPTTTPVDNALGCYDFLAVRDLDIGEMITVDYDACELESIAIPRCLCGEDCCRGSAKGFKDRMDEVMDDFAPHLPAYLLSYYEERKQNRNSQ